MIRLRSGTRACRQGVAVNNNKNGVADTHSPSMRVTWFLLVLFVYLLLVGVGIIGDGFKWISGGAEGAARIFGFS